MKSATFVEKSQNTKISAMGNVSATYASIQSTCPTTCQLRDKGCYAQTSYTGMIVRKLDKAKKTSVQAAIEEAALIDASFKGGQVPQDGAKGGRDLRIHVAGDARNPTAAQKLGEAAKRWRKRGGGDVWSYTHAWRVVKRKVWGKGVSVLASIDKPEQAKEARKQGYTPAVVVPEHKSNKAFKAHGITWIPCLEQTIGRSCTACRLCFKADMLYKNKMGIAFAAHGSKTNELKRKLTVIG